MSAAYPDEGQAWISGEKESRGLNSSTTVGYGALLTKSGALFWGIPTLSEQDVGKSNLWRLHRQELACKALAVSTCVRGGPLGVSDIRQCGPRPRGEDTRGRLSLWVPGLGASEPRVAGALVGVLLLLLLLLLLSLPDSLHAADARSGPACGSCICAGRWHAHLHTHTHTYHVHLCPFACRPGVSSDRASSIAMLALGCKRIAKPFG